MITNNEDGERLFSIKEVAADFKISIRTVQRLQQQRQIPFIKVGGKVRFHRSDLVAYLERCRVEPIR